MLNFQVILTQFRFRRQKYLLKQQQQHEQQQQMIIIFRLGSIKFDIKLNKNNQYDYSGGKRVILDITQEQLSLMYRQYVVSMFMQNQHGRFFSLLSLQKLRITQQINGNQIYFYNDDEEICYDGKFTINFNGMKNPRLPENKEKIEKYRTFDQFFHKPAVPDNNGREKNQTITSFLYGNNKIGTGKSQQNKAMAKTAQPKNKQIKNPSKTNNSKTGQNWNKKSSNTPTMNNFTVTQLQQYSFQQYDNDDDTNPPMMQFTNKEQNSRQKVAVLQTQLRQLNNLAPEYMKYQTALMSQTSGFLKNKTKNNEGQLLTTKIMDKIQGSGMKLNSASKICDYPLSQSMFKVNRQELKSKAKKQLQGYQGNNSIKIPIIKDGKYEYVDIGTLSQEQIKRFAEIQKSIQEQQRQKQQIQKRLKLQQRQNQLLKRKLEEKQKMILKQQEQTRKKEIQLLKEKRKNLEQQRNQFKMKGSSVSQSQSSNNHDNDDDDNQSDENGKRQESQSGENDDEQDEQYQPDFQSESLANSQKKSRLSILSSSLQNVKKQQQSYSYNQYDSYDPDFESFSQSLLDSQKKISQRNNDKNEPSYKPSSYNKYS